MGDEEPYFKRHSGRRRNITLVIAVALGVVLGLAGWVYYETRPSVFGPGPIEIQVTPDKQYFLVGEEPTFTIMVFNNQTWPVAYPDEENTHVYNSTADFGYATMNINRGVHTSTFSPNSSNPLHWTWFESKQNNQTIPHQPGNYTLVFGIRGFGYDASSNCTFEIRPLL